MRRLYDGDEFTCSDRDALRVLHPNLELEHVRELARDLCARGDWRGYQNLLEALDAIQVGGHRGGDETDTGRARHAGSSATHRRRQRGETDSASRRIERAMLLVRRWMVRRQSGAED